MSGDADEVGPLLEDGNDSNKNKALVAFLKSVADASVMAITLLNVYSTACVLKIPVNMVVKAVLVGLPLIILPILFVIKNIVKVAEQGGCGLGVAATLVLFEFIYVYVLGGVITVLTSGVSKIAVASVTVLLIGIVVVLWGCVTDHPKCLKCCRFTLPADQTAEVGGNNQTDPRW